LKKNRLTIVAGLLIATAGVVVWFLYVWRGERGTGPLPHEVYVWQRAWTQPVREAVSQYGSNFTEIAILAAEISWKDKQPQLFRARLNYDSLAQTRRPVGLALRIGPYSGPFAAPAANATNAAQNGAAITEYICSIAARIVTEARTNGAAPAELQIDFDCAESKLDGYRIWLNAIQQRVAPLPVTVTALPSWLNARAFPQLAAAAPNYVLQVHSVERPKSFDAPFTLCSPGAARRAVERAGRIGVPFRVALPTYGYTLAFTADKKFLGLSAEGPRPNWPTNTLLREVNSDPIEMAGLVRKWTANRPAALRGVIWYRLPTSVDNYNWRWPTLHAIVAARELTERIRLVTRRVESGLVEISLANEGELDCSSRLAVAVRWHDARLVAGDGLQDFELTQRRDNTATFQTQSPLTRLKAGDQLQIGWLRFDRDCEVQGELVRP